MNNDHFIILPEIFSGSQFQLRAQGLGKTTLPISTQTYDFTKSKGYGQNLHYAYFRFSCKKVHKFHLGNAACTLEHNFYPEPYKMLDFKQIN